MSLLSEFEVIMSEKDTILYSTATNLHAALDDITPTGNPSLWLRNIGKAEIWEPEDYQPGLLKKSWSLERIKDGWLIHNSAKYADWALHKREVVRGRLMGSTQNEPGIDPTIAKYNKSLEKRLKEIK